jgi:hypothetical protein
VDVSPLPASEDGVDLSARFRSIFGRDPSAHELAVFQRAHRLLTYRLPARTKRRTAMLLTRL